jgi:urease accessory protein
MLRFTHRVAASDSKIAERLLLPMEKRARSRQRVRLESGREAVVMLDRGTVLRDGDILAADTGELVRVEAAPESVSVAKGEHVRDLTRAAYHLGNRHVALEVGDGFVAYLHDHVLDDMVRGLGLSVRTQQRKFEPEVGAYGAHNGHHHGHEHDESVHLHDGDHSHEVLFEQDLGERVKVDRGHA